MKLQNGTEITFDFYKITRKEFVALTEDKKLKDDKLFAVMAKVTGVDVHVFEELSWQEWREVATAFWDGAYAPLTKASVSESTGASNTDSTSQEATP
jgi:hypothetical protein